MQAPPNPYYTGISLESSTPPVLPTLPPARRRCSNCGQDVTEEVTVRCAQCSPTFDLCVHCFSVGAQLAPHKAAHKYKVLSSSRVALYEAGWGADEELLLLEGVRLMGLGNWQDVAAHLGSKSAVECMEHYFRVYVEGGQTLLEEEARVALPPVVKKARKSSSKKERPVLSEPIDHSRGGYMPKREQFEDPYFTDAEVEVMDVVFTESDTAEEVQIKVRALMCLNNILKERDLKREFVSRNKLFSWQTQMRNSSREQMHFYNEMACLLQVMPRDVWHSFLKGRVREAELRRQIHAVQVLRTKGLRTHAEGEVYHSAERKRARGSTKLFSSSSSATSRRRDAELALTSGTSSLLTDAELALCAECQLQPRQYVLVKEALVREFLRGGTLQKRDAQQLVNLGGGSKSSVSQVFHFLVANGYINRAEATAPPQRREPPVQILPRGMARGQAPVVYRQTVGSSPFTRRKK